jgi:Xaa-Pro aminopeptidase
MADAHWMIRCDFPPAALADRRARMAALMGPGTLALLPGVGPEPAGELFRQTNELCYLAGVEIPQAYLLLAADGPRATLFVPPRPEGHAQYGEYLGAEDAARIRALAGVEEVRDVKDLGAALAGARVLYLPHLPGERSKTYREELARHARLTEADPWDGGLSREQRLIRLVRERLPMAEVRDLNPLIDALRAVKEPRELALLREAGRLAALAVVEGMRATRPGARESDLEAVARYVFRKHGAHGEGYASIVASGGNIWHLHYALNRAELRDGDLVLMDVAPDYRYYTSDIGRMWPVNGTYSPLQRALYGWVVEYHRILLSLVKPGATPQGVLAEGAARMRPSTLERPFGKEIYRQAALRTLESPRPLSHPVGMAVHDNGGYAGAPLKPGTVFTVDPELVVPEERLYIRVEDTVAVTEDGCEVLTAGAPLDLDAVEAVMKESTRYPYFD